MKSEEEIIKECKKLDRLINIIPDELESIGDKLIRAKIQALEWVLDIRDKLN